jgi:chromosome segregation protein
MLERLVVRGFKSFATETALELGEGVNVIVGPNGSGKSNLAEAVVWALGEQRASRLRAPAMNELLFQGGPARPAAASAEVVLQLAGGTVDGPAELAVSRRLARTGEAAYRVNGTGCRLLDMQEALAARGLGTDSLAIIRQGQVEALCVSRPSERRAMIDEAAGVGVAKRRRRRAEQKLARVADRLERARDLDAELTSRARALDRQARAAERAEALEGEIAAVREAARAAVARAADAALRQARERHAAARAAADDLQGVLEAARAARAVAGDRRTAAGREAEEAEVVGATLRAAAERLAGRSELAGERVSEAAARIERRQGAGERAAARIVELERQGEELEEERRAAEAALVAAEAAAPAAEAAEREALTQARTASEALASSRQELAEAATTLRAAEDRAARAGEEIGRLAQLALALEPAAGDLARAERRADVAARRAARDAERHAAASAEAADAAALLAVARERARDAAAEAERHAARSRDAPGGSVLGDALEVEPGLERAVAAALGALADAPIATDLRHGRTLVEGGAEAAIVPAPARAPAAGPAGARRLSDLVRARSGEAAAHVERLLAEAWLVESLDEVPAGHGGVFVTRDGHALRPAEGALSAARAEWARRALHSNAVAAASEARAHVERAEQVAAAAGGAHELALGRALASERGAARHARGHAALRADADAAAERAERARVERSDLELTLAAARERSEAATHTVAALEPALPGLEAEAAEAGARAAGASAALADAAAQLAAARARVAAAASAAAEVAAELDVARMVSSRDVAPPDLEVPRRAGEALAAAAAAVAPRALLAAEALAGRRRDVADEERSLAAAMAAVERAEADAAAAGEAAHAADVELHVALERASEAGPPPPGEAEDPISPDQLAERLEALERRRLAMGAVNPLAAGERAELVEREQELAAQIADLEAAGASLRARLGELDEAVGRGFDEVFGAVSERFSEVAELLFPDGRGRLRLVDGDEEDGEPGVEIEVVPAGKRPRALSLFSGGERSLVALAFCLALAMARPAPFYLLDEVEAALDDTNLRRFLGVIRRLASGTQFIVITHQQPTVEIADTLFGVTMGQDGTSQVLSRRLARSVEGPARPYVRRRLRLVN